MARIAGIELGGTNARIALADQAGVIEQDRFGVTGPQETLARLAAKLKDWTAESTIEGLGIASFGPVRVDPAALDYGHILNTPKAGWGGADLVGTLKPFIAGSIVVHTDVTAAAMAEGASGASRGLRDHVYMTVGTGVGIGVIAGGRPITGLLHPEGGHVRVRRRDGDQFAGACPFHGDCLEGLVSGPALKARCRVDPTRLADSHPVWALVEDELAEAIATLLLVLSAEQVVLGGGVLKSRPKLVGRIERRVEELLACYLPEPTAGRRVAPAALDDAGLMGALLMAERAVSRAGS